MDFDEEPQAFTWEQRPSLSNAKKHGPFRRAIPCMSMPLAWICCLLNLCLPGSGTLVAAMSICGGAAVQDGLKGSAFFWCVLASLLQLLTTPLIFGLIWSWVWAFLFVQVARKWWISSLYQRDSIVNICPCAHF